MKIKNLKMLMALALTSLSIACSKESTSNTGTAALSYYLSNGTCYNNSHQVVDGAYCGTSAGYYLSNGYCYNSSGQMVATTYCSTATTSGYYLSNGYCYNSSGQVVAITYCSTTTGGITTTACSGYYYWNGQLGLCTGGNCRGYTLVSATTGQTVYCQ